MVGDEGKNTLYHLRFPGQFKAERGRHGEGSNRTGRSGADLRISVPLGTQAYDHDSGEFLGEVLDHGEELLVAAGGRGGLGNTRFRSATRQVPRYAQPGEPGEERRLRLELKLLADVGVVGLPNAGKSTLISTISAARPKIADYPFTTLHPNLGVVGVDGAEFVVADIPGLIEGAHEGRGIGDLFLGHIERCAALLHLVDGTSEDVAADWQVVTDEIAAYGAGLADKPRVTALNKVDALDDETRAERLTALQTVAAAPVHAISGVSGEGVEAVLRAVRAEVGARRSGDAPRSEPGPWRP